MSIDQQSPRKACSWVGRRKRERGSEQSQVVPALHSGEVHPPLRKKEPNRQSAPECCFCMMGSHYYAINHVSDRLIVAALTALRRRQCRPVIRAVSNAHQQFSTDVWSVYMGRTAIQAYSAQPSLKDTSDVNDWMEISINEWADDITGLIRFLWFSVWLRSQTGPHCKPWCAMKAK